MAACAMLRITKTGAFAMAFYTFTPHKGVIGFQQQDTNHQRIRFLTGSEEAARETRCDQWAGSLLTKG